MTRTQMFVRMFLRPTMVRRGRTLTALLAIAVAAAVATATLSLYADVQAKLHKEFRRYGANVVITAEGRSLPADALQRVDAVLAGRGIAAPFAYAVAKTDDGTPVVVAGADFARVRKLNDWWAVTDWPQRPGAALLGIRAQAVLSPGSRPFNLYFNSHAIELRPTGTLRTGAGEDNRVYLELSDFERWTDLQTSTIEVAVTGSTEEVSRVITQLATDLPAAKVQPVRQIMEAEGRVLGKTRLALLASTLVIIFTAALCMLATLTASVLDRRKDFAVMKALGASNRTVNAVFAAEAGALGMVGALAGFVLGLGLAFLIGKVNFGAAVSPHFSILPAVLLGSVLLSLGAALVPLRLLQRVQAATILRGE